MDRNSSLGGLAAILVSSLAFGTSGTLVKPMLEAGWTPGAAVTARLLVAALALAAPALLALRGRFDVLWRARRRVVVFAVLGVALTQFSYFAAVQRIPVGTALLIEYLAPVGLVLLAWSRTGRRPAVTLLGGAALAVAGLVLVIGPGGIGGLDPLGMLYAASAAVGLGAYWVIAGQSDDDVPPLALTAASLLLGGLLLGALCLVGVLPFAMTTDPVSFGSVQVAWFVPVLAVALVSTALAYLTGILGTVRLGTRVASFLGLSEVVFAGALSWVLLGEAFTLVQLAGAALILTGVVLVRSDRPAGDDSAPPVEPLPSEGPERARLAA